jgi:hypothetical protein
VQRPRCSRTRRDWKFVSTSMPCSACGLGAGTPASVAARRPAPISVSNQSLSLSLSIWSVKTCRCN